MNKAKVNPKTKAKNIGGRPTIWSKVLEEEAWDYIEKFNEVHNHAIPSIEGLAKVLNVARSTLYNWEKDEDKGFLDILERVMDAKAFVLPDKGLKGEINAVLAKLMLTKHGYADKSDVNKTESPANDMTPAERVARLEALLSVAEKRRKKEEKKTR